MNNPFMKLLTTLLFILIITSFSSAFGFGHKPQSVPVHTPSNVDWNIRPVALKLNEKIDHLFSDQFKNVTIADLKEGVAFSDADLVTEYVNSKPKKMSIEYTARLYDVSMDQFLKIIPAANWGLYLHKLNGRGIITVKQDTKNRTTHQLERMVLESFPMDMDMTKAEFIEYGEDKVTVYWRVFFSNNKSTLSDVGSIEISKFKGHTLVKFRSAHRIGTNPYVDLAMGNNCLLYQMIAKTFLGHLENYFKVITTY